ncbi:MAG: elongation factor P [Candidatus Spechtbacterales bacterium]
MLTVSQLTKDTLILLDGAPHRVLEIQHKKVARQAATAEAKLRNLITGATITRGFNPSSDRFEEANIQKKIFEFVYSHKDKYVFCNLENKGERYELSEESLGGEKFFLKPNLEVSALFFKDDIISIELPIKVQYRVVEAPPNIRGNTVSGGTKQVKIESGATILTPLFIEMDDIILVNTLKGEYVERVKKSK